MPTPQDIQCFERLRATASLNFEDEARRREEFTDILTNGGILPARASRGYVGSSRFYDDGDLRAIVLGIELVYYVQEVKHEIGTSNSDPYVEAIHYWIENVRYFMDHTQDNPDETRCNLPAIIVLHFGPYLAIAAAVYDEGPNVEHLCCIPLHAHTTNEAELQGGERALAALRVAVHALRDRYPNMPFERTPRADFPFRDFYKDDDGKSHRFTYIEAIEEKRIFRVLHEDGTPLCVKFSKRYSAAAHKAAHSAGFAPALRAVNEVYDWTMVVMDDKTAEYPKNMWDIKAAARADPAKTKPTDKVPAQPPFKPAVSLAEARKQVQAKLAVLHEKGFVHGDLRDVNVLVRKEDAPGDGADILIVDWDWAGVEGEAKYPRSINPQIARPLDALAATNIKAEHDVWMVQRLLK
ncbi:hypothetical protein K466DRAFT_545232 [Polyporus arcularius HHB13444]|uniref:Uncharacterized protein n=1 Tax=Polyporus arcularius HHB13444 TaxID=1314778 RepID=A0A5C3PKI5_9APHY|nr:hypothetical protein K466DRAFT_545232 [Polyporus arcularius HHB13444]